MKKPLLFPGKRILFPGIALVIAVFVYFFRPGDIRIVEKNTKALLSAVNKIGTESLPVAAAKSTKAGSFLSGDVLLTLGDPFPDHLRKSDAISLLQQARMQADRMIVTSRGHQVTQLSNSEISMDITLEGFVSVNNQSEKVINSYRLTWVKIEGEWKITKAEVIEVIHHPSGNIHPF
jgi:hypothetical protein